MKARAKKKEQPPKSDRRNAKSKAPRKLGGMPIESVSDLDHHNRQRKAPFSETHPEVAVEWLYEKNCGFGPEDFTYGSKVNAFWRCSRNKKHIWRTQVLKRCAEGRGCPHCKGTFIEHLPVPPERSLLRACPKIAKELHPKKNGVLTAADLLRGSGRIVWWKCPNGHSWQSKVTQRTKEGVTCPKCKRIDLRKYPDVLKYFDHKRNEGVDPHAMYASYPVWWRCPKGPDHAWFKDFRNRDSIAKPFCPFCRHKMVSVTNSLLTLFPQLAKEWHDTKNGDLKPSDFTTKSMEHVWWRCRKNKKHEWPAAIHNRTYNKSGCPDCWIEQRLNGYFKKLAAKRKRQASK